jgi:hypothetical protein
VIEEIEDSVLKCDGNNIMFDLYVSFAYAALGTNVEKLRNLDNFKQLALKSNLETKTKTQHGQSSLFGHQPNP